MARLRETNSPIEGPADVGRYGVAEALARPAAASLAGTSSPRPGRSRLGREEANAH